MDIVRGIQDIWSFLAKEAFKKFSNKILLDNNMTHLFQKNFSKNVYNRKEKNSFKGFKFLIFGLLVFFLIKIFKCDLVKFENYKLQSFRKCIT